MGESCSDSRNQQNHSFSKGKAKPRNSRGSSARRRELGRSFPPGNNLHSKESGCSHRRLGEETEKIRIALDAGRKVMGTIRPSTLVSEKWLWETLREATSVSKTQVLRSIEGTTPAAGVWTLGPSSLDMASSEGSTDRDLDTADGDSDPQATPSQALASEPQRPLGKGSSMKR
ncbi:hypothetical protein MC885_000385 [Smutsia gigantea]|nr:hypothetical protein MC885_000385 [Smutsia gigantea]